MEQWQEIAKIIATILVSTGVLLGGSCIGPVSNTGAIALGALESDMSALRNEMEHPASIKFMSDNAAQRA